MHMTRHARCSCGQLSIRCEGEPGRVGLCHCLACQRRTGSAFGVAAFFPEKRVQVSGQSSVFQRIGDSGEAVVQAFCPLCGATVFWRPAFRPGMVAVAVGAFADPAFPRPDREVYVETRHPWLAGIV